ncbi:MAG: adenosine deaminase [Terriglobia bacterium]|jgi:adenosine deaminase/aminodeoxyfutalosine deaminase
MLDPESELPSFIARLPKVELHVHLEGAVRPETLRELSQNKSWLKQKVGDWISERRAQHYRYGSFGEFLVAFGIMTLLLEKPEDYALAATRLSEWLAEQNVKYAEIIFSAGAVLWKKQSVEAVFEAAAGAAEDAETRTGVRIRWIFDAVRHFGLDHVREVLGWAARYRSRGVVAFGIGGNEERGPARLFSDIFRAARDQGLHVVAHAGEACGPESIRDAVELLGAERIGHGLTAYRDPQLMAALRERRIPLEVCPSSNVATGLIARFEDHPLPKFLAAGLVVTLNSDDPAMFGTSLENEFLEAARCFGFSRETLTALCLNAARASFLGEEEKQKLCAEITRAGNL